MDTSTIGIVFIAVALVIGFVDVLLRRLLPDPIPPEAEKTITKADVVHWHLSESGDDAEADQHPDLGTPTGG